MIVRALPLLALLVVAGACERYDSTRDEALKKSVTEIRGAIARFHRSEKRYPHSLDELVPRYLRQIPVDPFTQSAKSWRLETEESVQPSSDFQTNTVATAPSVIIDVHSTAPGADRNGVPYANY